MNNQSLSWNIVTKNVDVDPLLRKKLSEKTAKLEKHLKHFPSGTVHLHIALERHAKKSLYTAALTVRVPSNILHAEKSAADVIKAFDDAVKALLKELESLKADLRHERLWKRKARRGQLQQLKASEGAAGFTAEPMAGGPQNFEQVVRELFQQHYDELLRHARRHIRHDELASDLPWGGVEPRDIVDEVARQAEQKARQKPKEMSWMVWFYHLLHEEFRRQRAKLKQQQVEDISSEEPRTLPENAEAALHPLEQIVKTEMEPEVTRVEDLVPNPEAVPPDRLVEAKDLLENLRDAIQQWPRLERDVFELYFIQGFEPDEIAMITSQPLKKVQESIANIQNRVREEILEQEVLV